MDDICVAGVTAFCALLAAQWHRRLATVRTAEQSGAAEQG